MKKIKESEFTQLKKGDLICIGEESGIEIVTDVLDHTFYSAPLFQIKQYEGLGEFQRSSHWAGCLGTEEDMIVFDSFNELKDFMLNQVNGLMDYYKLTYENSGQ